MLRALGLSLEAIGRVLSGRLEELSPALAAHQARLESRLIEIKGALTKLAEMRANLAGGRAPSIDTLSQLLGQGDKSVVAFDLPWPWGGERFELRAMPAITYIVGPLGSGKTQLAKRLAVELDGALFLGLERNDASQALSGALQSSVAAAMVWLLEDGATDSLALRQLLAALLSDATVVVVDMVEQGLDHATQEAVIAYLRQRGADAKPLFLMTRSNAILDLDAVGPNEAILYCPANHSPPMRVVPVPGTAGYEAVATCLATPEVRARTEGVVAMRPQVA
jgi:hypothetical protein